MFLCISFHCSQVEQVCLLTLGCFFISSVNNIIPPYPAQYVASDPWHTTSRYCPYASSMVSVSGLTNWDALWDLTGADRRRSVKILPTWHFEVRQSTHDPNRLCVTYTRSNFICSSRSKDKINSRTINAKARLGVQPIHIPIPDLPPPLLSRITPSYPNHRTLPFRQLKTIKQTTRHQTAKRNKATPCSTLDFGGREDRKLKGSGMETER